MRIFTGSKEFIRVPISARDSGAVVNPTADAVVMALPLAGVAPVSGDWKTASWETDSSSTPTVYYARMIVGPGGTAYAAGEYDVWVKVTDNPEIPAMLAGQVVFF